MSLIKKIISDHISVINELKKSEKDILTISEVISNTLKNHGTLFIFGNGGSAADAQHMAAELIGRFKKEREGFPAIALTTDTSIITALGNDYGFNKIFERQISALATNKDITLGISTSGNSENVLNGILAAKTKGCITIGLSGGTGGKLKALCDYNLIVTASSTARIQEGHCLIIHLLCELIEVSL